MKKITTKLSNLHKLYSVREYETEFNLMDDIFIETIGNEYQKINSLVLKKTPMIACEIDGVDSPYICAERHLIMTPTGWKFMIDADVVTHVDGSVRRVTKKVKLGVQDSYDVSLDSPHTYVTSNGLIHHNTFCAMYKALEEVLDKSNPFKKVIVVRSAVQGREIGHLPGSIDEKMDIYEQPYRQICETLFDRKDAWERLKEQGYTEFISTSFIRGCTWDNAIIIVDEMQNLSFEELHTAMTRVGHMSKIIVCGDYRQTDLKKKNDMSGIHKFLDIADLMCSHTRIEFVVDDICRSSLVKDWIIATLEYEDKQK